MATSAVTPERVKDILSSFLYQKESHKDSSTCEDLTNSQDRSLKDDGAANILSALPPDTSTNSRSYSSFLKRVETFSPLQWFAKPVELSPMVCARYGWENSDCDMLYCKTCNAHLCGSLPSKADSSAYTKACKTLEAKLLTTHERFCLLSVNPCPESYLRIDLDNHEQLHRDFWHRVKDLHRSQHHLPEVDYGPLQTWGFHKHHAAKFMGEKMAEADTSTQTVTLCFTGWSLRQGSEQILLCSMCQRQIGLWNYKQTSITSMDKPSEQLPASGIDDSGDCEPSAKLRKIEVKDHLDPIGSHHAWCPWLALRRLTEDVLNTSISSLGNPESSPLSSCRSPSHNLPPAAASPTSTPLHCQLPSDAADSPVTDRLASGGSVYQHVPAWLLAVHIIAPGLVSQSHRLTQEVKQSTMIEGLRCIRKVLSLWSPPTTKAPQEVSE